ncbi:MAG TPA: hypothetical protein VJB87_05020 [Candidatus Nanoarchaeia archaeon]|nr:hypothetical protein [Candidatus Nanoarchaeia archaeon]
MGKTTIQVSQQTLERLRHLRRYEQQPYDETLNIIFDEIEEETLTTNEIEEIQKGLEDIKKGKTKSIEQVAKELGIKLV